ncbi:rh blood group, D antigen isoform X1 [Clupea harengus]|uniref:Rh blood group, D antigen isoform X1 n=2 Tax=Clupea harengus TaxID=7950 RepID=A0A6P8G8C4_CLUHA|nr:rh blood group, D antigen isoform X1 [Clupea harengus]
MAPQYAPSLRSRLPPIAFLLETVFILFFVFYVDVSYVHSIRFYAEFQDVHVMVFMGFGFFSTFLVRYGFSSSGFSLLVAAMAVQWAIVVQTLLHLPYLGRMRLTIESLVFAEMSAASSLIAMGVVLGKTNPVHLLLMSLMEVAGFTLNHWLLQTLLKVKLQHSLMLLHIYGAFFGIMTSWTLGKGIEPRHEKEKSDRKMALFSLFGTLFLWMLWPSFNSLFFSTIAQINIICSTYLSMAVSAVTAIAISVLSNPRGKINMLHVQSGILAGGVAVGATMSTFPLPWVAMAVGLSAGIMSTLGSIYIKPLMQIVFKCHDTCSILSVYGIPGILGWFVRLFLQLANSDSTTVAVRFAAYHITILLITLASSVTLGVITGVILKLKIWRPPQDRKCYDDQAFWEFPHLAERK